MRSWLRVALLLFAVAWGTNHFVPLLLVYRARLALSSVELAVLFGVYAVGLVPGLLLGGPLSDRWGRRRVVLPASIVALVGTLILAWGAAGFGVLLAGRFVVGLGAGATFSAGTAWVQDLAEGAAPGTGARRAAVALSCGFGGGPLVTSILAQWLPSPMRLPYLIQRTGPHLRDRRGGARPPRAGAADARRPAPRRGPAPARSAGLRARRVRRALGLRLPVGLVRRHPGARATKLGSFAVVFAGVVTAHHAPLRRAGPARAADLASARRGARSGSPPGRPGSCVARPRRRALSPAGVLLSAMLLGSGYGGCLIAGLRFVEAATTPRRAEA